VPPSLRENHLPRTAINEWRVNNETEIGVHHARAAHLKFALLLILQRTQSQYLSPLDKRRRGPRAKSSWPTACPAILRAELIGRANRAAPLFLNFFYPIPVRHVRNVDYILWQHRSDFAPNLPFLRRQLQGAEWVEYRVIHQNTINLLLALHTLATPPIPFTLHRPDLAEATFSVLRPIRPSITDAGNCRPGRRSKNGCAI